LAGHLHTFRHTFISRVLTSGIPEITLQKWVGHLDPEVTRLYSHVLPPESHAAMNRLTNSPQSQTLRQQNDGGNSPPQNEEPSGDRQPEDQK
jgi:hypothetical protein